MTPRSGKISKKFAETQPKDTKAPKRTAKEPFELPLPPAMVERLQREQDLVHQAIQQYATERRNELMQLYGRLLEGFLLGQPGLEKKQMVLSPDFTKLVEADGQEK
jgi:hypothetical protein